ncbi:hypothetical protein VSS37_09605 [Candidatus Thiothrix sp. Deng01]|uniref:Uncharacterized protein n=1 Tax=Candidatus Thiothrix phosphatis TaxID=3112415 RepID=A0ABU6CXC0_9GAMM|nr:hypothetical protein [Candidatus Thiothrix sp. Deng01]MEB4591231.1 hypothetical protein [Candidatus Thiothrix sp. Deng01]
MKISDLLKSNQDDGAFLFNDKQRAIKNHKLMQLAKAATFGLYMVAVFMLYVADVWGIGSFIEKNSNEFVALGVFSVISFVLAYFLASSKEAVYEDIAIHRSEGWQVTLPQYAAMGLFLSSGILFEMFSTTSNQQHIANSAAESSSLMKSIQQTDVTVLGSSSLTDSYAKAQVRMATCQKRLAQGKAKDCVESQANLDAVKDSMAMGNRLAMDASKQAVGNKVEGMLKVRESFDKPMFQAMAKYANTDNNTGMVLVIAVLIFIFECQHIMALFAYANALRRIKQNGGDNAQPGRNEYSPAFNAPPAPSVKPANDYPINPDNFKATVAGLFQSPTPAIRSMGRWQDSMQDFMRAAPFHAANAQAKATTARNNVSAIAADKLDSMQDGLNKAQAENVLMDEAVLKAGGFKQRTDKTYRQELAAGEKAFSDSPLDKPRPAPHLSVEATVKQIQREVKASGASSPETIRAAVFDSFAAMPNPAPLGDAVLNRIADKLAINWTHTAPPALPSHQKPGGTGLHNPALGKNEAVYPLPLAETRTTSPSSHTDNGVARNLVETLSTTPENLVDKVQQGQPVQPLNKAIQPQQQGEQNTNKAPSDKGGDDINKVRDHALVLIWKGVDKGEINRVSVSDKGACQAVLRDNGIGKSNTPRRDILDFVFDSLSREGVISQNPEYTDQKCGKDKWLINPNRSIKYID